MLMEVEADCDGVKRSLLALVDTGAQVNLIRHDLFPKECFRPARNPLALSTVSCEALPGGRNEVHLKLKFAAEKPTGEPVPQGWITSACFHDADIGCDAILSYEWMAHERINVPGHMGRSIAAERKAAVDLAFGATPAFPAIEEINQLH